MRVTLGSTESILTTLVVDDEVVTLDAPPTVTVTSDGTALPDITPTNYEPIPNVWRIELATTHTDELRRMTVTVEGGGARRAHEVEVVSSRLFDLAELRSMRDIDNTDRYPLPALAAARDRVEEVFERAVGASFCLRRHTETHPATGPIILREHTPITLIGAASGGTALDVSAWTLDGSIVTPSTTPAGPVTITYDAGVSAFAPSDIAAAALTAARAMVLSGGQSGIPDRARGTANEFGSFTFSVAGVNAPTGYPEVDAVLLRWRSRLATIGVG